MNRIIGNTIIFGWKFGSLAIYLWTMYISYKLMLAPLIAIHGLWSLLGITFGLGFLAFASSYSFFYMPPKRRGATPRPFTSGDIT